MNINDIIGKFSIIGTNQNESNSTYKGVLHLSINENNQITANWLINNEQEQTGIGFFKNNILVINFEYLGIDNQTYRGTVVYQCLNKDILDGFWSEEYGNPKFLGSERCFRIQENKEIIN